MGSHISLNKGRDYLLGTVKETVENDANIFMIFTGPPQNLKRVPISEMFLKEAKKLADNYNIDFQKSVVHAPYIFNLAQRDNDDFIHNLLVSEITRMSEMGIQNFVIHPGYCTKITFEDGLENVSKNIKKVLKSTKHIDYWFCLETMAGKSNQLGRNLEELNQILEKCKWDKKLGICLDTCHLHDSGYDIADLNKFKKEVDKHVGLERVKVIHLGDSMNPRGERKDRHANYGYGHLGWETILSWAYDPFFSQLPIIVETPFWKKEEINSMGKLKVKLISPYKHEIKLLRTKQWEPIPDPKYSPKFNIRDVNSRVS